MRLQEQQQQDQQANDRRITSSRNNKPIEKKNHHPIAATIEAAGQGAAATGRSFEQTDLMLTEGFADDGGSKMPNVHLLGDVWR